MSEPHNGQVDPVSVLANRLRLVQIDYADRGDEVRRGHLTDEIEHALAAIAPDERVAFLRELDARFPVWDPEADVEETIEVEAAPPAQPVAPTFDESKLNDTNFL